MRESPAEPADGQHPGFPNPATPVGSSAYYSVRFSPEHLRRPLALLYAWNREMHRIPREVRDPGVARVKLQWWREEMERACAGQARHPLTLALTPTIHEFHLPLGILLQPADHAEARVLKSRPDGIPALEQRLAQDQGALAELLARCHGVTDTALIERVRRCGAFWGGVYLVRDYGASIRQEHDPLPPGASGDERLRQWGMHIRKLAPSADAAPLLPPAVAIRGNILDTLLREIELSDFDVKYQRIGLTPLRKLWIAWRTQRRNRFYR